MRYMSLEEKIAQLEYRYSALVRDIQSNPSASAKDAALKSLSEAEKFYVDATIQYMRRWGDVDMIHSGKK